MTRIVNALLMVGLMMGLDGCYACDDIGCQQGVSVHAATDPVESLQVGATYRVEVIADGRTLACERMITNEPIPKDEGFCRDRDLFFGTLGNPNATSEAGRLYVHLGSTPAQLEVRITRGGVELGKAQFDVKYRSVTVGAGDCEQECQNSEDKRMTLSGV